ncbi:MAG TPA: glycosyltransferase [Ktedonobacteraceae bacterium]|nr:glycosyltransferase [Ktedonobacteraceae bacterium]
MNFSVAMLSIHTSPLAMPGQTKDAGGMNVYMRKLADELGKRDITVDIYTRRTDEYTPRVVQCNPNIRVIHIQAGPLTTLHKNDLYRYVPVFAQHIEDFRREHALTYDILHSHYWLSGVAAMELAQRWDVPHVTMFHTLGRLKQLANPDEPEPRLRLEMEQRLIQHADGIIATTYDERTQIIRSYGATANSVHVVPCGVDLSLFTPITATIQSQQQIRKKLGLKPHLPVLLFAGRLDPFKGPDVLLQAAAMMQEKAQIVIVGGDLTGDSELETLRKLAAQLHISQRVHFLGAHPQDELPLLYRAADVTVVPSYHESFGLVAVESLASGTPVVATRAGGLVTVVRNGETGYLVPRCPGFFAERLDALLQNSDLLEQMRLAARPSVLRYSWKSVASHVYDIYDELISETQQLVAQ